MSRPGAVLAVALAAAGCIGRPVVDFDPELEEPGCPNVAVHCDDERMPPMIDPITEDSFVPDWRGCAPVAAVPLSKGTACADVVTDLPPGAPVVIENAVWSDARIVLRATEPALLRLQGANLERVLIVLEGRAWLEIGPGNLLTDVVIDADPAMEGRVVTVTEGLCSDLAVRTGPRGEVRFERAQVSGGVIDVGSLLADEATLLGVGIRAGDAVLAATNVTGGRIEVGRASFLGAKLEHVDVVDCEAIRFRGGEVSHSYLAACTEPTVFWGGSLTAVRLEGAAELSGTAVLESALAPGPGRALRFADAQVATSVFCDAEEVTGATTSFLCVACVPDIPEVQLTMSFAEAPQCPAIHLAAQVLE